MKTILVGYEERPVFERVLQRAAELANLAGAGVIVTSVAPVIHGKGRGPIDPVDPPERHQAELDAAIAKLRELGVDNATPILAVGDPADAIVNAAQTHQADLIVLGAHHGNAILRAIAGSVGDKVAHHAHADVLIVH